MDIMIFNTINNVILLLFLIIYSNRCLCDICKTCICSVSNTGPIIDCHDRHLNTNEMLNFDLLTLDHQKSINKLILSRNNILLLPIHVLRNLKHLKKLDLSQNQLDNIHTDIFKYLNHLEDLNYSNNFLFSFDISSLNLVSSLVKLNLSHNQINYLERNLRNTHTKLRSLDLSHNNISSLGKDFLDSLLQLEQLDLSFNKLTSLDSLIRLQHLKVLHINNNHLRFLNFHYFPISLMECHAGNNLIDCLLLRKSLIQVLKIENNQIFYLPENLTLLEEIKYLNISENSLSSFPEIFLKKMESLDLSFNDLSVIPESVSTKNLPMLKVFCVNGNHLKNMRIRSELRLERFEANFIDTIEKIEKEMFLKLRERKNNCINVSISNNMRLNMIEESNFQHMNVCSLNLSNNRFAYLSSKLIHKNKDKNAKYLINLQGNPFICNCSLQWMLDDLIPFLYVKKLSLLEDLRCASPPPLTNKRLVHWYQWQNKVFCGDFSEKMVFKIAKISSPQTVTFETSIGMLAALGIAIILLTFLMIIGILLTRRITSRKRRINRKF